MTRDYRDTVIETLADREDAQFTRVVELTIERDAYRLVALEAVARLHGQHVEIERLRARLLTLRDELRRYTAATIGEPRRAA